MHTSSIPSCDFSIVAYEKGRSPVCPVIRLPQNLSSQPVISDRAVQQQREMMTVKTLQARSKASTSPCPSQE
jgi:hypothetical protein